MLEPAAVCAGRGIGFGGGCRIRLGCGSSGGVPNICHSSLSSGIYEHWTLLEENVGMISPKTNGRFCHAALTAGVTAYIRALATSDIGYM